jgi:hypothetical protein
LSIVSETMNATRLPSTIRQVPARRSKSASSGDMTLRIASQAARKTDAPKPQRTITCALTNPSRRVGAVRCATSISDKVIPIK